MNKENYSKELIKSRKYFDDAITWYYSKYLYCLTERAWIAIFFIIVSILLLSSGITLYRAFPIKLPYRIVMYNSNSNDLILIKKLTKDNYEDPRLAILRYLLSQYVIIRESYNLDNNAFQLSFMEHNSSYKVFRDFKNYIDAMNMSQYRINLQKKVSITDIAFKNIHSLFSNTALVSFKISNIHNNKVSSVENKRILIKFTLSDINLSAARLIPLEFIVLDYETVI